MGLWICQGMEEAKGGVDKGGKGYRVGWVKEGGICRNNRRTLGMH